MNQSKLSYKEIIDKLQELEISINDFAFNGLPYIITEEDEQVQKVRDEWFKNKPSPGNTTEYKIWREKSMSFPSKWDNARNRWKKENNLVFTEIHQQGGESKGDHWESVKYFPDHDVYIKVTGFYQSYYGTEFNGGYKKCCSEVKPKEKTITVYE